MHIPVKPGEVYNKNKNIASYTKVGQRPECSFEKVKYKRRYKDLLKILFNTSYY
jgi:hypothetical protein